MIADSEHQSLRVKRVSTRPRISFELVIVLCYGNLCAVSLAMHSPLLNVSTSN
jgi:hypothetical protein